MINGTRWLGVTAYIISGIASDQAFALGKSFPGMRLGGGAANQGNVNSDYILWGSLLIALACAGGIYYLYRRRVVRPNEVYSSLAEKLLYLFLTREQREHLPGDLAEEVETIILPKFGRRYAKFWYWWQVLRTILTNNKWAARFIGYGGGGIGLYHVAKGMLQDWGLIDAGDPQGDAKKKGKIR